MPKTKTTPEDKVLSYFATADIIDVMKVLASAKAIVKSRFYPVVVKKVETTENKIDAAIHALYKASIPVQQNIPFEVAAQSKND